MRVLRFSDPGPAVQLLQLAIGRAGFGPLARDGIFGLRTREAPYAASFAGFKDLFIQDYRRPGFTIEAGRGVNPLPLEDFDAIYAASRGILTLGALVT